MESCARRLARAKIGTKRRIHSYDLPESSTEDSLDDKDAFSWEMIRLEIDIPATADVLGGEY